jgi:hypothetical protein
LIARRRRLVEISLRTPPRTLLTALESDSWPPVLVLPRPLVRRPLDSHRHAARKPTALRSDVNRYEPGPSSTSASCISMFKSPWSLHPRPGSTPGTARCSRYSTRCCLCIRRLGHSRATGRVEGQAQGDRDGLAESNPAYLPGASPEQMRSYNDLLRLTAPPATAVGLIWAWHFDQREIAPQIRCPTCRNRLGAAPRAGAGSGHPAPTSCGTISAPPDARSHHHAIEGFAQRRSPHQFRT